jgi:hypothetical protein
LELFIVRNSFHPIFTYHIFQITGEFTGNRRAPFPYLLAGKHDQTVFSRDCAPEGFLLADPDHLNGFQIDTLYNHWLRRQQKKLSPFVILNASPQHAILHKKSTKAMGKRKMEYLEVDSNDEEVETGDEGVQEGEQGEEEVEEEDQEEVEEEDQEEDQEDEEGDQGEDQDEEEEKGDGDEEIDEGADDKEEDIPPTRKYGRPNGKTKKSQPSTQLDEGPNTSAGPSKIPPAKKMSKKKARPSSIPHLTKKDNTSIGRPNTRNSAKNMDAKKRKAEEELGTAQDPKRLKTADSRKSGRRPGKARVEEPVKVSNPDAWKGIGQLTDLW